MGIGIFAKDQTTFVNYNYLQNGFRSFYTWIFLICSKIKNMKLVSVFMDLWLIRPYVSFRYGQIHYEAKWMGVVSLLWAPWNGIETLDLELGLWTWIVYLYELVPHGAGDEGLPQSSQEVLDAAAQNVSVNLNQIKPVKPQSFSFWSNLIRYGEYR